MGCCKGKEIEWKDLTPKEIQALRTSLASYLTPKIGQGATPYGGAMTAGIDPLQLMGANMMMGMGGYGTYKTPPMYGMGNMPGFGGGAGATPVAPPYSPYSPGGGMPGGGRTGPAYDPYAAIPELARQRRNPYSMR